MIVYLSLKQIILNQINVLIRKVQSNIHLFYHTQHHIDYEQSYEYQQADKSNDEPERIKKRLNNLQQALEQVYNDNNIYCKFAYSQTI